MRVELDPAELHHRCSRRTVPRGTSSCHGDLLQADESIDLLLGQSLDPGRIVGESAVYLCLGSSTELHGFNRGEHPFSTVDHADRARQTYGFLPNGGR